MPLIEAKQTALIQSDSNTSFSKYLRKEDLNFLYYITEESVEDSEFDSIHFRELKQQSQNKKNLIGQQLQKKMQQNKKDLLNSSSQKQFSFSKSFMSQDQEFDKLLQITSRCIDYYNRFSEEKNNEFGIIQKTFDQLSCNLNSAFQEIVLQANRKNQQIQKYLNKKHNQIVQHKNNQDQKLKLTLDQIKSVHLSNLLAEKQSLLSKNTSFVIENINPQSQCKQKSLQLSIQLHNYASTLNKFYCLMQQIETNNFKQVVEDCVSFINNLITEEIKCVLYQKIPNKIQQKMHKQFNLADQNVFERLFECSKSLSSDSTDSLFKEIHLNCQQQKKSQAKQGQQQKTMAKPKTIAKPNILLDIVNTKPEVNIKQTIFSSKLDNSKSKQAILTIAKKKPLNKDEVFLKTAHNTSNHVDNIQNCLIFMKQVSQNQGRRQQKIKQYNQNLKKQYKTQKNKKNNNALLLQKLNIQNCKLTTNLNFKYADNQNWRLKNVLQNADRNLAQNTNTLQNEAGVTKIQIQNSWQIDSGCRKSTSRSKSVGNSRKVSAYKIIQI